MNWIDEINNRMEKSRLKKKEAGITEKIIKRKQIGFESGIANKGKKHSEATKKIWSEKKIGTKIPKEQIERQKLSQSKIKFLQLLEQYPKELILEAIEKYGNYQKKIIDELNTCSATLHKLCKYYSIPIPKKSNYEKTEYARVNQSESILVWECSKNKPFHKIGNPKEYYSVSFCCNSFEPKLHKGNMLRNLRRGTPYRNMFFEYKDKF